MGGPDQFLQFFRSPRRNFQKTDRPEPRLQKPCPEKTFQHHKPDRPGRTGGNKKHIHKRCPVCNQQYRTFFRQIFRMDHPDAVKGVFQQKRNETQQELRHLKKGHQSQYQCQQGQYGTDRLNGNPQITHRQCRRYRQQDPHAQRQIKPAEIGRPQIRLDKVCLIRLHRHQNNPAAESVKEQHHSPNPASHKRIGIPRQHAQYHGRTGQ